MKKRFSLAVQSSHWLLLLSALVSGIAVFYLGYRVSRTDFTPLLLWFVVAFLAYFLQMQGKLTLWQGLALGMGLRLVLLFSVPALSDDYFRFIWDGHLLQSGHNPFLSLPSTWISAGDPLPPGLSLDLYHSLNSPHYYSVYPPVCQFVFWASTFAGNNLWLSVVLMRCFLLLAEAGTLLLLPKLLTKLHLPPRQALWYALNPAILVELTGNLHFEALLIFFLVAAFYLLAEKWWKPAAVLFGFSVASKLLPLLLLPLVPRYLGWRRAMLFGLAVAGTVTLLFSPFMGPEMFRHVGASLSLYFQKFEFNASVYYLLRELGFLLAGYNLISYLGVGLSLLTFSGAFWMGFFYRRPNRDSRWLVEASLLLFCLYLFFATVVHPWYISTAVAVATCTRFRFPMLWSAIAVVSYAAYQSPAMSENLWLVALEYAVVVGFFFWEITRIRKNQDHLACIEHRIA